MARNKHPEETVAKILDVAMRLFVECGYEQTSMQNIIDELGGLPSFLEQGGDLLRRHGPRDGARG